MRRSGVLVIAGWAQPATLCQPLCRAFSDLGLQAQALSLPPDRHTFWGALEAFLEVTPAALLVGWSLGGQLLLEWWRLRGKDRPSSVQPKLAFVACNPSFLAQPGWPGMSALEFERFRESCNEDVVACLQRFALLQVQGDSARREHRLLVGEHVAAMQPETLEDCRTMLDWLTLDERQTLDLLGPDTPWCLGRQDILVPASLADLLPFQQTHVLAGMAHFPGPAHAPAVAQALLG